MKYIALILLFATNAFAWDAIDLSITSGTGTNVGPVAATNALKSRGGVVTVAFSVTGGSATCRVETLAGKGLSRAASRTVIPPIVVTTEAGLVTNILNTVFLHDDVLVFKANKVGTTGTVTAVATVVTKQE